MFTAHHLLGRMRHHALAVLSLRPGPVPQAAMLRSGVAIGSVFLLFLLFGRPEAAILGAFVTNFLCLLDKATHVVTRVWVQVIGAAVFTLLGIVGIFVAGSPPLILFTVFGVALLAGWVHGTSPGIEAVPRFGLCFLIVAAFVPINHGDALAGLLLGTAVSVATVLLDDYVRNGRRGPHMKLVRGDVSYPGPRFSLVYGGAAAVSMVIGLTWSELRPYWVPVTTLLVMQPDRRANTVRVAQRFLGTLAGVIAAFTLVQALPDSIRPDALLVLALTLPFLWPFGFDRNYALGVAILSAWVLLLLDTALPSADLATPLFLARLSDTSVGCAVALAGSFVVYEARQEATG